ncbi:hypothetical protein [Microviridae sp.]|nr:hypothetical protein [Microviridae sp.]
MRTQRRLTILTTHIKTDVGFRILAKTFHKPLKVGIVKRATRWQVLIIVRKCNEGITVIEGRLVQTTHGPLARSLQPASNTLTTGKFQRTINTLLITTYKLYRAIHHTHSRHRVVAAH